MRMIAIDTIMQKQIVEKKLNFYPTLHSAEEKNLKKLTVNAYVEPPDAHQPEKDWRLYVYEDEELLGFYEMQNKSFYLFGRDKNKVDIPTKNPTCSRQHAAIQYRIVDIIYNDGSIGHPIKSYLIDLGSTNGTYINKELIEPNKYYELKDLDVLSFGHCLKYFYVFVNAEYHEVDPDTVVINIDDEFFL